MCLAGAVSPSLCFGNLNNGSGNAGLSYLNANNGLSNRRWNYLGRTSELIYIPKAPVYPRCGETKIVNPVG